MNKTETFIGACSKYIDGQGWTTEIPISQIEDKGYRKIDNESVIFTKKELMERDYEFLKLGYENCEKDNKKREEYIRTLEMRINQLESRGTIKGL